MSILLKIILILSLLSIAHYTLSAQDNTKLSFKIDHFAINVDNLNRSADWYQKVFDLKEIYDGTEQEHIRWFRLGESQELHIIEVQNIKITIPKGVHIALTTRDLTAFINRLVQLGIEYYDWPGSPGSKSIRPDGIEQVYITDPDGYWIEINNGELRHTITH